MALEAVCGSCGVRNAEWSGRGKKRERAKERGRARGGRKCEESRKPLILHQPAAPSERESERTRANENGGGEGQRQAQTEDYTQQ